MKISKIHRYFRPPFQKSPENKSIKHKNAAKALHLIPEKDRTKWVSGHFHSVARRYDFMNTLLSFGIHHLWKRSAVKMMEIKDKNLVIDVCGGTGDLSRIASKRVGSEGKVILYDINPDMLKKGRDRVSEGFNGKRIKLVLGNAEKISFQNETFDVAMVGFGIRNLANMRKGFQEIYRILKPNGQMMCLEFSRPISTLFQWIYDCYSFNIIPILGHIVTGSGQAYTHLTESIRRFPPPDKLSEMLKEIGFSNVTYQRLTNGIAVVHIGTKN